MFSRASCQTREEHRLERFFLPGNLLFAPLQALLAAFQYFAFLPTTLFWQTGDLPNIRVRSVSAIFCAPYFLALSVCLYGFAIDKITIFFSNRLDFLCIELSTLLMPCFAMLGAVRQRRSRVLECKLPDAFDGSKKLCGRFPQSFRVYWRMCDYPSVLASIFSIATISGLLKILSSTSELSPACCTCSSTALSCASGTIFTPFPP